MTLPKVSICMPVYNGGHYFGDALQSALSQEYDNLEIVVVNDGSNDGGETERIARAAGDRVTYVWQENRGVGGALNTALKTMTGDYFAWLSHDDLHLPHKTAAQIGFLGKLGRPDACLFSDFDLIGPDDEPITTVALPVERIRQNPRLPLYNGMINGCTLLIPAAVMRAYAPFDESRRCTQDYDLWTRVLAHHEFFHQPEVLIRYRLHPGQGTHTPVAVTEGDVLWQEMLASRTEVERAQMFGSTRRYYTALATFLEATPYRRAAAHTRARAEAAGCDALVSVALSFRNQVPQALRAARSVLDQTHRPIELLLVDDGSSDDTSALETLAGTDPRVRLLREPPAGLAAARNRALAAAQGAYIGFLDAGDRYVSTKIERQLDLMQHHGALFSHTSVYTDSPASRPGLGLAHTGQFGGDCYPRVIADGPIAFSSVMIHRSLVDAGLHFSTEFDLVSDHLAWIDLALRYTLLGIDEPLSVASWSSEAAALPPAAQMRWLSELLEALARSPQHRLHHACLEALRRMRRTIARDWIDAGRNLGAIKSPPATVRPPHPLFPAGATGRAAPIGSHVL